MVAPKPGGGRAGSGKVAYLSEKRDAGLRGQEAKSIEEADDRCTLNPTLSVEQARAEMSRPGSGPALALRTFQENPSEERLMCLVKAVLHSRGMGLGEWERHRDTVCRAIEEIGE
jgi:hypothetical protein